MKISTTPLGLLAIIISAILGEAFLGKWGAFIGVGILLLIFVLASLIFGWVKMEVEEEEDV
jgi:predicted PurR-regulated permease PerM